MAGRPPPPRLAGHPHAGGATPELIYRLQLVWVIKHSYMIHYTERVQYELSSLMGLTYPGDANLAWFKDHIDHMFLSDPFDLT